MDRLEFTEESLTWRVIVGLTRQQGRNKTSWKLEWGDLVRVLAKWCPPSWCEEPRGEGRGHQDCTLPKATDLACFPSLR